MTKRTFVNFEWDYRPLMQEFGFSPEEVMSLLSGGALRVCGDWPVHSVYHQDPNAPVLIINAVVPSSTSLPTSELFEVDHETETSAYYRVKPSAKVHLIPYGVAEVAWSQDKGACNKSPAKPTRISGFHVVYETEYELIVDRSVGYFAAKTDNQQSSSHSPISRRNSISFELLRCIRKALS